MNKIFIQKHNLWLISLLAAKVHQFYLVPGSQMTTLEGRRLGIQHLVGKEKDNECSVSLAVFKKYKSDLVDCLREIGD